MMDFVATFQHWLTLACIVALAVCLFALAVLRAIPELTDAIRRFCGMDNFSKIVFGVCIVGAVLYGGSKGVNVRWDDGLRDNGTLITNDTVAVRWTYSGIPGASSVFIDYREAGTTNKWLNLAETLASAQEWTGTLANATNYDYWVYSTYVPPVPVHTNGVWVGQAYETKAKVGAAAFLILNGKVQEHSRTIAPPKWTRPLPYDAEVEYLESTGTQYIDTGVKPSEDLATYITFCYRQIASNVSIFGSRSSGSSNDRYWVNYDGKFEVGYGNWTSSGVTTVVDEINYIAFNEIVGGSHRFTFNNTTVTATGTPNTSVNIIIFGRKVGNTAPILSKMRLYGMRMVRDGVPVRDYIAVRKGNVGYLYDRVSGQLFGNNGTGAFGVGSDK